MSPLVYVEQQEDSSTARYRDREATPSDHGSGSGKWELEANAVNSCMMSVGKLLRRPYINQALAFSIDV